MTNIVRWFSAEVHQWRTGASVAWTLILLLLLSLTTTTLASFDILHPFNWLWVSVVSCFSITKWIYMLILLVAVGVLVVTNAKYFSVQPQIPSTRSAHIWNVISPHRLGHACGHSLAVTVAVWCYLKLIRGDYSALSRKCSEDSENLCLNEQHLFLVLHGAFVGWIYAVQFFMYNHNHITFPIMQQSKFFQVKSSFVRLLFSSMRKVVVQLAVFYLIYYLMIIFVPAFIHTMLLSLRFGRSDTRAIDGIWGLLDRTLLFHGVLSGTLIHFTLNLASLLYRVYHAEPFEFAIESVFTDGKDRVLHCALASDSCPLIQHLGFLDLFLVSKHSPRRRQELFNLSQPGGHPHNWNAISSECLNAIRFLTMELTDHNNNVMASGSMNQMSTDRNVPLLAKDRAATPASTLSYRPVTNISALTTPGCTSMLGQSFLSPGPGTPTPLTTLPRDEHPVGNTSLINTHNQPPPTFGNKIWGALKKKPLIAYFVADLPDTASRRVFRNCQMQTWAVEALGNVCAASYSEDIYGVVQKSLPDILTALLSLQEAVEKHFKLGTSISRKGSKGSTPPTDILLRSALKTALKTAVYRIVTTFDVHLNSIQLSTEHCRRLRLFMEYKE